MSERTDGGPAFPQSETSNHQPMHVEFASASGMSLRDYFAASALGHIPKLLDVQEKNLSLRNIAEWSYQVADAMLAERERKPE